MLLGFGGDLVMTFRKHPKLEYSGTLISFVVAMLTFSDRSLRAPSQETH